MKKLLSFWEVILLKMRFGQALTLSYIENAFLWGNSEENAFLLGFWEVILPKIMTVGSWHEPLVEHMLLDSDTGPRWWGPFVQS